MKADMFCRFGKQPPKEPDWFSLRLMGLRRMSFECGYDAVMYEELMRQGDTVVFSMFGTSGAKGWIVIDLGQVTK